MAKKWFRSAAFLASASLLVPANTSAYEIGSGFGKKAYDLHETFTTVARECLDAADGKAPSDCSSRLKDVFGRIQQQQPPVALSEAYAARWPDDPTRMLDRAPSKIRFGLKFLRDCEPAMKRGPAIDNVGLLCSSHFGRLQFMHAQMLSIDAGGPPDARALVLAWAEFAFNAATDHEFRASDYCKSVKETPNQGLKQALTFASEKWCHDRPGYPAWRVATLFALHCNNPLQENRCWEKTREVGDEEARLAARGAVLHLIQDSFSQAHVARIAPGESVPRARGPFVARIMCRRPVAWYDYNIQNLTIPDDEGHVVEDAHGVADHPPLGGIMAVDPECYKPNRAIDDPVTASAMAMWFMDRLEAARDGDKAEIRRTFRRFLELRVFPL
jgi:hypothetical protein